MFHNYKNTAVVDWLSKAMFLAFAAFDKMLLDESGGKRSRQESGQQGKYTKSIGQNVACSPGALLIIILLLSQFLL